MVEVLLTLRKVLILEQKKDHSNTAVAGGLGSFTNFLKSKDAVNQINQVDREIIERFLISYSSKITAERIQLINELLDFINLKLNKNDQNDEINFLGKEKYRGSIPKETKQDPALFADIQTLWGIGENNKKLFNKLSIFQVYDLLRYFPRRYQDYSNLKPINDLMYGEEITVIGSISKQFNTRKSKRGNLKITETSISDSTGFLRLTWFNQPYIQKQLKVGDSIVISGKVDSYLGRIVINNPDWELLEKDQLHTNRIVPIYPLTSGIGQRQLRKIIYRNLGFWSDRVQDYFPSEILDNIGLPNITNALQEIHFPGSEKSLKAAQKRFAVEEIFFLQLGVLLQKIDWVQKSSERFLLDEKIYQASIESLPYKLTNAQTRAIGQIRKDLNSGIPMNRLLQGDVGSGKTVVAKFAIETVVCNGGQAALMAPTSILAEQHFKTLLDLFAASNTVKHDEIALLIGGTPQKSRNKVFFDLISGKTKVLIGTHALIEDPVEFENLALVVIDEQHRFGVKQRASLREKGTSPHLLVMTATPIPRSLALTIYGDMEVTIIDEMPAGRLPVNTRVIHPDDRDESYQLVHEQAAAGNQAFIVYPKIHDDDDSNYQSAVNEYNRLSKEVFPNLKVSLIHGQLNSREKEQIMTSFHNKEFDILVSTTVIEVGVDIPNATIIIIEGANRFGLAQLHQLRGRVGRNKEQAFCILIPEKEDAINNERLRAMESTNDGFVLADLDLKYRGPGEFLGTRQSGFVGFRFASLTDLDLINTCRKAAIKVIEKDPALERIENQLLKFELNKYWPALK
jgi:ATP-dependent DNA helicase RecG